jgi:hypothetical protein
MWKEFDFADPDNRICRDCEKLVNRRQAEFNPVPELDDEGSKYDSIFSDSVSEPYTVRRDLQFDNIDYLAALDVHTSNLQLGGRFTPTFLFLLKYTPQARLLYFPLTIPKTPLQTNCARISSNVFRHLSMPPRKCATAPYDASAYVRSGAFGTSAIINPKREPQEKKQYSEKITEELFSCLQRREEISSKYLIKRNKIKGGT